jgi:hypothetical protein
LRGVVSFCRWKAALDLFLLAQLAVQTHLFVEVGVEPAPAKQH